MCFDAGLPFVRKVYDHVGRGELDACATWLTGFIKDRPATRLHCALDVRFDHYLPEYSDWLFAGSNNHPNLNPRVAVGASMGEFEINYHDWTADAVAYDNYDDPDNAYQWLCESDCRFLCDPFHFTGLETLREAFAHADDYDDCDPNAKPPYESDIYTAVCYLVFVCFLRLNRLTHERARDEGHGLARAHLFCHYGDCLFHSPPLLDSA